MVPDPLRCPLCGEANACRGAVAARSCWCAGLRIAPDVLERAAAADPDGACVCQRCAEGKPSSAEVAARIRELVRRR